MQRLRVLIQWPSYGPYHVARFQAAQRLFETHGAEVIALETARKDTYDWASIASVRPSPVEVLFPDRPFDAIRPYEMHRRVWHTLDRLNPDAVAITSYSFPDARACLLWCRRHRRTAILMSPSKADDAPRHPLRERIKSLIVREFDAALVGGRLHREYYERLGLPPDRIFPGYNAVDNARFIQETARLRQTKDHSLYETLQAYAPYFLVISRFIARKNLPFLLEAYAAYRTQTPTPWNLIIVGDGPLYNELKQRNMPGVWLAGKRPLQDVLAFYAWASAFILPSLADQWGLVVNEAMAAALPVLVSTGAGCHPELVIPGRNGFTFDPTDRATLTNLMLRLTHLPEPERNAMGEASLAIIRRWGPERFAEGLWQAVLAGKRSAERGPHPVAYALLTGLNYLAPRPTAFHSVEA